MPIFVRGLTLGLDEPEDLLLRRAASRLRVPPGDIRAWAVVRRALDARRHDRLQFTYNVELALAAAPTREAEVVRRLRRPDVTLLTPQEPPHPECGHELLRERPVVVGFGPAGMFAGLLLAERGYRPIILERGQDVSTRHRDIMVDYYRNREFHAESNLLFGEGGAGAYSDGKIYTRVNDPRVRQVLEAFYHHGADPDILIDGKPHIGSDKLPGICRRIRLHIESLGGEVRFGARLDDLVIEDGQVVAAMVNGQRVPCGPVLLAIGHSARDTYRMLAARGVTMEPKPFQVGVRIEHPQTMVDRWQYGPAAGHDRLPPADYHLVAKGAAGQYGDMFSFCMCPGGLILPTNESPGEIATNGASRSKRGGEFANAGLVITVDPRDVNGALCGTGVPPVGMCGIGVSPVYGGTGILPVSGGTGIPPTGPVAAALAALDFQETLERAAFAATGGSYRVPAQRACDLVAARSSTGELRTSFPLGGQWTDMRSILPGFLVEAISRGLQQLDRRLRGFAGPDALVTAPETRASGPIRIPRDPTTRESTSTAGLYPLGEGAGYAGGILSAAMDGLKTAELLISKYAPLR
jgi:uncharacterized protein